jgi:hypothetical protein
VLCRHKHIRLIRSMNYSVYSSCRRVGPVGQAKGKFAIKIRSCRPMIVPMTTHPDNEISPNYSQVPCMIDPWTPVVRARSHKC